MPSAPADPRARAGRRARFAVTLASLVAALALTAVAAGWHRVGRAILAVTPRARRPTRNAAAVTSMSRHTPEALALARWDAAGRLIARGVKMAWQALTWSPRERVVEGRNDATHEVEGSLRHDRRQHLLRLRRHERAVRRGREPLRRRQVAAAAAGWRSAEAPDEWVEGLHEPAEAAGYARSVDALGDAHSAADESGAPDAPVADALVADAPVVEVPALDLAAVEADLADVEIALARLEAGTYWTCEVTGEPLPDDVMAREPLRRRLPTA